MCKAGPEPEASCPVCGVHAPQGERYCGPSCEMTDASEACTEETQTG
jgi:hypothetical protein